MSDLNCNSTTHTSSNNSIFEDLFQISQDLETRNTKIFFRIQIVLLVLDLGYSQVQAAIRLGTTPKTIGKWIKRFNEEGKQGLLDKQRSGRPREIPENTRKLVVRVAISDPSKITDHLSTWSLKTIQRYLNKAYNISISESSIHRILQENGISFRKVEETMVSPDPEYEIKKKRIDIATKEAENNEDIAFLCLDEKGPIHALYHRGKGWMNDLVRHQIPRNHNKSNGTVVLNAAFEPDTNKFWWYFSERRTGEAFLMLLIQLSMDPVLQKMKKVYLLMDNLPAHFTKNIKDHLDLHPKFVVLRLPTYSPELNPIERVFADLDRQAIQNHYYKDTQELEKRLGNWLEDRKGQPVKAIKPVSARKTHRQRMKKVIYLR